MTLVKEFTKIIYGEGELFWAVFFFCFAFFVVIVIPYLVLRQKYPFVKYFEEWLIDKFDSLSEYFI